MASAGRDGSPITAPRSSLNYWRRVLRLLLLLRLCLLLLLTQNEDDSDDDENHKNAGEYRARNRMAYQQPAINAINANGIDLD